MRLAKDRFGRIGRQTRSQGLDAIIDVPQPGARRGQLYISGRSIEADQTYFEAQAREQKLAQKTKAIQAFAKRKSEEAKNQIIRDQVIKNQRPVGLNGMNEKFKRHFAKLAQIPESERVARTIKADFHINEEIPGDSYGRNPEDINWRSDYRQQLVVGNVLTRDGSFGPVTDYERFVKGDEMVNQRVNIPPGQTPVVIGGGTMAGRYRGHDVPVKVFGKSPYRAKRMSGMGDDYDYEDPYVDESYDQSYDESYDNWADDPSLYEDEYYADSSGIEEDISAQAEDPSFWEKLYSGASSALQKQLPTIEAQAIAALKAGGTVTQKGGIITIQQPGKAATSIHAGVPMFPAWSKYAAFGLLGLGVLLVGIKLVKK